MTDKKGKPPEGEPPSEGNVTKLPRGSDAESDANKGNSWGDANIIYGDGRIPPHKSPSQ